MIIYFDTNVLLTLYLHPRTIVESLLKELETNFGNDIVIPFRVVFEFGKNRQEYIHTNFRTNLLAMAENKIHDANNKILSALKSLNAIKELDSFNTDYSKLISEYSTKTDEAFTEILRQVGSAKSEFRSSFSDNDDPVRDFVNRHASKVSYSNNRLIELTMIYDTRARCGIGPGKTDFGKKPSAIDPFVRAGDFIIWYEILNNVPRNEEAVFITEEKKADFFGLDGGIDPYLQSEFDETNPTATIEFLSLHDFLKTYIYESCDDQLLVSYFEGKRKKYEEIFNEKSFVDDCLDNYYDLPYDFLDDHISDGLDGYSIDSFDEIVVDDVERVTPFADVDLEYHSDTKTITGTIQKLMA